MTQSLLIYVPELAGLLGLTENAVRVRLARGGNGLPPHVRIGKRIAWRRRDVEKWLNRLSTS